MFTPLDKKIGRRHRGPLRTLRLLYPLLHPHSLHILATTRNLLLVCLWLPLHKWWSANTKLVPRSKRSRRILLLSHWRIRKW